MNSPLTEWCIDIDWTGWRDNERLKVLGPPVSGGVRLVFPDCAASSPKEGAVIVVSMSDMAYCLTTLVEVCRP